MKELPKILELLSALRQAKLRALQEATPGPCLPNESRNEEAAEEMEAAVEQYHTILSLWATGAYCGRIAPPQVQQLVNTFLLNPSYILPGGLPLSEPDIIEPLRREMQDFIDGWLDLHTEK